jgi:hypothetical protein
MPILTAPHGPTHSLSGTEFTSLATPSRGSNDLSVWTVEIAPGTPATPHALTREEVFVVPGRGCLGQHRRNRRRSPPG